MTDQLDVLTCTKCGAPIAFGDDATSTCPFCQTANDVPAVYREMRAGKQLDAASRAEAERLLKTLDRPPWLATKVFARMFDWSMFGFLLAYGIPLALYSVGFGMHFGNWVAHRLGKRSYDDVPYWVFLSGIFGFMFFVIFVPRVAGIYANRRVTARMRLLGALAAKPPRAAGGPARCRHCDAPLFVATGDVLAVCSFCGAENAVQLRTTLVAAVTKSARKLATTVNEAAATDRSQKRERRRLLLRELVRYAWPTAFFFAAFATVDVPTWGPILCAIAGLLLIGLVLWSGIRNAKHNDAQERRAGNDVPGWVAAIGPILVWWLFIHGPTGL